WGGGVGPLLRWWSGFGCLLGLLRGLRGSPMCHCEESLAASKARQSATRQSRAMGTCGLWVAPQPLRLLRCARNDSRECHCEECNDAAISGHGHLQALGCSPPFRLLRCARNDRGIASLRLAGPAQRFGSAMTGGRLRCGTPTSP